jgi:hypothetical protein
LIGGKIPLFRQVTNFSCKLLKRQSLICCKRDGSIAKNVIFVVFAPLTATQASRCRDGAGHFFGPAQPRERPMANTEQAGRSGKGDPIL